MDIIDRLKKMGFSEYTFSETIAILWNGNIYKVMPLGVKLIHRRLYFRVYRSTSFYNLLERGASNISLNITFNPLDFYNAVLYKDRVKVVYGSIDRSYFIEDSYAYIIGRIASIADKGGREYVEVFMVPIRYRVLKSDPWVYNRAFSAIVEALIYYTKIPFLGEYKALDLIHRISILKETIYHSTAKPLYRKIIDDILIKSIELFKKAYMET